jgi:hypothetical protein
MTNLALLGQNTVVLLQPDQQLGLFGYRLLLGLHPLAKQLFRLFSRGRTLKKGELVDKAALRLHSSRLALDQG